MAETPRVPVGNAGDEFAGLSVRVRNCLSANGVVSADDLRRFFEARDSRGRRAIFGVSNLGNKSIAEIAGWLGLPLPVHDRVEPEIDDDSIKDAIALLEVNGYRIKKNGGRREKI